MQLTLKQWTHWRTVLVLVLFVAIATTTNTARAQAQDAPAKPVLVVSVNNFDGLMANLKYLGTVLDDAQYLTKLSKMSTHLTAILKN